MVHFANNGMHTALMSWDKFGKMVLANFGAQLAYHYVLNFRHIPFPNTHKLQINDDLSCIIVGGLSLYNEGKL